MFRVFLLALASTVSVLAQSTFGSFVGSVHDPSGAALATCKITVTNKGTSAQRTTLTDQSGSFVVVNLEPGTYEITMEAPGFQRAAYTSLELLSRQTLRVDGNMTLAKQTESVNVSVAAEAPISTEVSNIAETKLGRELNELPVAIASRGTGSTSAITTLTTQPGVEIDGSGNLSVAGAKPSMLSMSIDGISSISPRNSGPITELFPSFDAIAEIRVSEINNTAEFGGVSDITTISRGGTNSFHGGVFENIQNNALNARNTFSATVPKLIMNDFGGFIGGPVSIPKLYKGRDRTFFFMSYEGLRLPKQNVLTESVPSLALRSGDLSAYLPRTVKDPLSGLPFANNQIPLGRISPISLAALKYLWPLPNAGAPNAIVNNYVDNFPTPISSNQGDIRLDQNINSKQSVFARFTYKRRQVQNSPNSVLVGPLSQPENDYALTGSYNNVISPHLVNELRAGFSGANSATSFGVTASQMVSELGLTLAGPPPPGNAVPNFSITGFQGTSNSSSIARTSTDQVLDNLTWTQGKHTMKIGGDYRHLTALYTNVFAVSRMGSYRFNNSVTNSLIGNPYGAFLLGIPDSDTMATVLNPDTNGYANHYAVYAQDDWKITSRLTINFGLRWEYHPAFVDHYSNVADFLPNYYSVTNGVTVHGAVVIPDKAVPLVNPAFAESIAPTAILTASQAGIPQSLRYSPKTDFAPRIGFAWRPFASGKTVIRGGYGRFIETELGNLLVAAWAVEASDVAAFTNSVVNGKPQLTFPYPFPSNLAQPGSQYFDYAGDVHYKDPYVQQWNFTIERDLGFQTGLRVSYDGSHGSDLGIGINPNEVPANTVGFATASKSAPYPLWSQILLDVNGARSNYNALTVSVNKRMSKGLQFTASYNFAKNLSNGAGYAPGGFAGEGGGSVTDQYNYNLDYGNVAYTRRQRFLTTFLYNLPFGYSRNRVLNQVVSGWELAGVLVFETGPFLTVVSSSADPGGSNFPNLEGSGRADIVSGASLYPSSQTINSWINPAAFAVPANNIGRYGNSPIGSVVGPGTQAVSLSLFRTFKFTERLGLRLGVAASNALNHPNYGNPGLTLESGSFGRISSLQSAEGAGPRSVQLSGRFTF